MNLIAMVLLAPALGYFVTNRRHTYTALVAAWAVILMFQTHLVLLEEQKDTASYSNTAGYFAINYVFLAAGIGVATLIHRRRHRTAAAPPESATARADHNQART